MRGTRRTIVTAAASFAVVLGIGGVAAATGSHSGIDTSAKSTTTSLSPVTNRGGHHPRGRALGVRKQQEVTSTTVAEDTTTTIADDTTTTTVVDDTTSTTIANETTTTVPDTTPTTEVDGDHKVCDDHGKHDGEANEADEANEANEANESGPEDGNDSAQTTRVDNSGPGSDHSGSHHGAGGSGDHGGRG